MVRASQAHQKTRLLRAFIKYVTGLIMLFPFALYMYMEFFAIAFTCPEHVLSVLSLFIKVKQI